ncbi:type II CRISPR-associated endonuclease Cas1 [Clostridium weizhouense]|uniref:CRISPR-associated endonuclease Cas1 n=1 Tax=Clostridium weizhouense TaxID=2859781 RepID=A0ABS7ALY9_9CLOT|nr:type II CRISPR-associated endonuclease Cas1 [Clostridium weizhouense]MBW6409668.1 type II CRISPR-associated endonuclease Cas1 [Clostridium weizhouense]
MSWRTVVISSKSKLSYKNNYLIVRNDDVKMIHLSEINTLVIDTTLVSITSILICELLNRKIKIIFCDEKHNPNGEVMPYYGSHNTSKKVAMQAGWDKNIKALVWKKIIKQKIKNQSNILKKFNKENIIKLNQYIEQVQENDSTNREGHSAKVYFNSLFGMEFNRELDSDINSALDYGYTILLSAINREIVNNGYITQIGINHKNEFNQFNLGCDLMEIFRPVVDKVVYENRNFNFDREFKYKLINVLNEKICIDKSEYYLSNGISLYLKSVFKAIEDKKIESIIDIEVI